MKTIREWLPDWAMVHSSEDVQQSAGVRSLLDREVASEQEARDHVNKHLDFFIRWLDDCRPRYKEER